MGKRQSELLLRFQAALSSRFANATEWEGGQGRRNTAAFLEPIASHRRPGQKVHWLERLELGDRSCTVGSTRIILEYESGGVNLTNLLKYWPYLRGELSKVPSSAIALCHFSGWLRNYPMYRDLRAWLYERMATDPDLRVGFVARQFDHWGQDR